jgi:hypothetical protein
MLYSGAVLRRASRVHDLTRPHADLRILADANNHVLTRSSKIAARMKFA